MNRKLSEAGADIATHVPTPDEIELAIEGELDVHCNAAIHRPQISYVSFNGEEDRWCELRFTIVMDDLELPFELPDSELLQLLHGGIAEFAATVAAACADVLSRSSELRTKQSAMRQRVEDFSRKPAGSGLELPLVWLSLAPYDRWITPADVRFDIALAGLGHDLRAEQIMGEAGLDDDLVEAFDHALDTQRQRARQNAGAGLASADGLVDVLTFAPTAADLFRSRPPTT